MMKKETFSRLSNLFILSEIILMVVIIFPFNELIQFIALSLSFAIVISYLICASIYFFQKREWTSIMKKQHLKFFIRYAIFLFVFNYGSQTLVEEGILTKNLTYILILFPIYLVGSLLIVKKSYFNQNDTDQGKEG